MIHAAYFDENGNRIHTQNSVYLEEGKGYNKDKIAEFENIKLSV